MDKSIAFQTNHTIVRADRFPKKAAPRFTGGELTHNGSGKSISRNSLQVPYRFKRIGIPEEKMGNACIVFVRHELINALYMRRKLLWLWQ